MTAFDVYGEFFALAIGGALMIIVPIAYIALVIKFFVTAWKNRK